MTNHTSSKSPAADAAAGPGRSPAEPARARRTNRRFVDDYLPALLGRASQLISSEFHQIVSANGFTVSEWRVLASLEGGEPLSIGQLAAVSLNKQPTLTRMLDRMEGRGQVERVPHGGGDRRITRVRITPLGSRTVAHLISLARRHAEQVLAPFGRKRAEELKTILREIIELHQEPPADTPGPVRRVRSRSPGADQSFIPE